MSQYTEMWSRLLVESDGMIILMLAVIIQVVKFVIFIVKVGIKVVMVGFSLMVFIVVVSLVVTI